MTQERFPTAYYTVPQAIREQASVVITVKYFTARGRNEVTADGVSIWYPVARLEIMKDYSGTIKDSTIDIEPVSALQYNGEELTRGATYLILLKPSKENKEILAGKYAGYLTINDNNEILAILPLLP